jgi:hypothetical protein
MYRCMPQANTTLSDYLEQQQLNHPYPLLIKEVNKVSPLIQEGLRGVNGLPNTTGKQCDKVELITSRHTQTNEQTTL